MTEKPMLILLLILTTLVCLYFWFFDFSHNRWIRYGQYGGVGVCILFVIDEIFKA